MTNKIIPGVSENLNFTADFQLDGNLEEGQRKDEYIRLLNQSIRELKDENGRLLKLVSERELELRRQKKKLLQHQGQVNGAAETVDGEEIMEAKSQDQMAAKILQLSKRVRELTAEKESEKTKAQRLAQTLSNVQRERDAAMRLGEATPELTNTERRALSKQVEELQDRVRIAEQTAVDVRNQSQALKKELLIAHKVLQQEVGDQVNVTDLLRNPNAEAASTWRGRAQQIQALQIKLQELKSQLDGYRNQNKTGRLEALAVPSESSAKKYKALEQSVRALEEKLDAANSETDKYKRKLDAVKTRNIVLSEQIKSLQSEQKTLLQKAEHDDQLVQSLLKQVEQFQGLFRDQHQRQSSEGKASMLRVNELQAQCQQLRNESEQMSGVIAEKQRALESLQQQWSEKQERERQAEREHMAHVTHVAHADDVQQVWALRPMSRIPLRRSRRPYSANSGFDGVECASQTDLKGSQAELLSVASCAAVGGASCSSLSSTLSTSSTALLRAAEVERDRLNELVELLQRQLAEQRAQVAERDEAVRALRLQTAVYEKQMARTAAAASAGGGAAVSTSTRLADLTAAEYDARLECLRTENEALRSSYAASVRQKEEDLLVYQKLIQQLKQLFYEQIAKQKSPSANGSIHLAS